VREKEWKLRNYPWKSCEVNAQLVRVGGSEVWGDLKVNCWKSEHDKHERAVISSHREFTEAVLESSLGPFLDFVTLYI
jgi:hypothetical protein